MRKSERSSSWSPRSSRTRTRSRLDQGTRCAISVIPTERAARASGGICESFRSALADFATDPSARTLRVLGRDDNGKTPADSVGTKGRRPAVVERPCRGCVCTTKSPWSSFVGSWCLGGESPGRVELQRFRKEQDRIGVSPRVSSGWSIHHLPVDHHRRRSASVEVDGRNASEFEE